jgi:hypothetical protein
LSCLTVIYVCQYQYVTAERDGFSLEK